jgi:hypothetical protein
MPVDWLKKCRLADDFGVQENEVSLVRGDRRFALIWRAAQTQQSKMRSHVAIPSRARQTLEVVFRDFWPESV